MIPFPFPKVRAVQDKLIEAVADAIASHKNLVVHAPTGLGKTIAVLAPALDYAHERGLTIFFLTSRHTQHKIAIETLREINQKFSLDIISVSILGKRWMCLQPDINNFKSPDFAEYCKIVKEQASCEFFMNLKHGNKPSHELAFVLSVLEKEGIVDAETLIKECGRQKLCPYEVAALIAKRAQVVISDYSYIFNPNIQQVFFSKTGKELGKSIIIVDEAHNLPARIRESQTLHLSSLTISNAMREAKRANASAIVSQLSMLQDVLNNLASGLALDQERLVERQSFIERVGRIADYKELVHSFAAKADDIRSLHKKSYLGVIASFLSQWLSEEKGYARIIAIKKYKLGVYTVLSYHSLDPSLTSGPAIEASASTVLMSGTLVPTSMFRDLLGVTNCIEREFSSPFDEANRLTLVVPNATTKYSVRSSAQFRNIAYICINTANLIPGNAAVFFPSYFLKSAVGAFFKSGCAKAVFEEHPGMTKSEKSELLEKFRKHPDSVLLAVAAGSFGEGIDLPGNILKCVIVVGLPFAKPGLETQKLMEYYDKKFGRGWDYGYMLPAMTKCLQNAGRCIRSETDRGVIVFLDQRYTQPGYLKYFPESWRVRITSSYQDNIRKFFSHQSAISTTG